ncbi:MAG TPA: hemolysin family protein [Gemmatimonadaceae bacterium]|nr:hemolysin family protein [Gemmatimonadaceae bacterium]
MLPRMIAIAVLLLLNGFFVAAEFALVRSRRTRLESMARTGDWKARLALRASGNLARVYSASQLGVTLASLALGALAESSLGGWMANWLAGLPWALDLSVRVGLGAAIALAIVTFFHVVFGELAPRGAALSHPEEVASWLTPPLLAFAWVAHPVTTLLNRASQRVLRAAGQRAANPEENVHSPEELRMLVEQSQEGGVLQAQDASMLEGVFEFSEKNAREVMTPRTEIDALPIDATLDDTLVLVEESGRSRYPVYEETIDNIVGLVLAKDLIPILRTPPRVFTLRAMMRPVHVVPGTREVEEVLADFKRLKEHMAVVLDEYGGTAGLVTMEDLLEEIVGEILDEYDEPPEHPEREGTDLVIVPGGTNIAELNERFGLDVPDDHYTTIGGFIFGALGRLPVVADRITAGGAVFTVREMEGRRVDSLAVDLHAAGDRRAKERSQAGQGG